MNMLDIAYQIPEWVQTLAVAAAANLTADAAKQGIKTTVLEVRTVLGQVQSWAKDHFGEKASITKSIDKVLAEPNNKAVQERLIQDLKDDASPDQLASFQILIQELKQHTHSVSQQHSGSGHNINASGGGDAFGGNKICIDKIVISEKKKNPHPG